MFFFFFFLLLEIIAYQDNFSALCNHCAESKVFLQFCHQLWSIIIILFVSKREKKKIKIIHKPKFHLSSLSLTNHLNRYYHHHFIFYLNHSKIYFQSTSMIYFIHNFALQIFFSWLYQLLHLFFFFLFRVCHCLMINDF